MRCGGLRVRARRAQGLCRELVQNGLVLARGWLVQVAVALATFCLRLLLSNLSTRRHLRHELLLAQRDVEQVKKSQIHLRVDLELAVLLEDAQNAELLVEDEVLVALDQNVRDIRNISAISRASGSKLS